MSVVPRPSFSDSPRFVGGVDAGGTKFLCAIGTPEGKIERTTSIKTESPDETLGRVAAFFNGWRCEGMALASIGISAFGPICRDPNDSDYGRLRNTPKPDWGGVDLLGYLRERVSAPLSIDTDVNGAALAEGRWGAAKDIRHYAYVTVGTGVGVGIVTDGKLVNGMAHPELGHYRPRRLSGDQFEGICPFHGDCLEGLVSGPAIERRVGRPGSPLTDDDPVWPTVAGYLAHLCGVLIFGFSPRRIILGGGVMERSHLFPLIRAETQALLGGYSSHPLYCGDLGNVIVPSGVTIHAGGDHAVNAGVLGGFILAERAIIPKA